MQATREKQLEVWVEWIRDFQKNAGQASIIVSKAAATNEPPFANPKIRRAYFVLFPFFPLSTDSLLFCFLRPANPLFLELLKLLHQEGLIQRAFGVFLTNSVEKVPDFVSADTLTLTDAQVTVSGRTKKRRSAILRLEH